MMSAASSDEAQQSMHWLWDSQIGSFRSSLLNAFE